MHASYHPAPPWRMAPRRRGLRPACPAPPAPLPTRGAPPTARPASRARTRLQVCGRELLAGAAAGPSRPQFARPRARIPSPVAPGPGQARSTRRALATHPFCPALCFQQTRRGAWPAPATPPPWATARQPAPCRCARARSASHTGAPPRLGWPSGCCICRLARCPDTRPSPAPPCLAAMRWWSASGCCWMGWTPRTWWCRWVDDAVGVGWLAGQGCVRGGRGDVNCRARPPRALPYHHLAPAPTPLRPSCQAGVDLPPAEVVAALVRADTAASFGIPTGACVRGGGGGGQGWCLEPGAVRVSCSVWPSSPVPASAR